MKVIPTSYLWIGTYIGTLVSILSFFFHCKQEEQQERSFDFARSIHHCLSIALKPIKQLQCARPLMRFRRGDEICNLRIICPVATVMGDREIAKFWANETCPIARNLKRKSKKMNFPPKITTAGIFCEA
jgi:hypothetical protein